MEVGGRLDVAGGADAAGRQQAYAGADFGDGDAHAVDAVGGEPDDVGRRAPESHVDVAVPGVGGGADCVGGRAEVLGGGVDRRRAADSEAGDTGALVPPAVMARVSAAAQKRPVLGSPSQLWPGAAAVSEFETSTGTVVLMPVVVMRIRSVPPAEKPSMSAAPRNMPVLVSFTKVLAGAAAVPLPVNTSPVAEMSPVTARALPGVALPMLIQFLVASQ